MTEYKIDPITWYSERQLSFTPAHFTISITPLSAESETWVFNKLSGRFSIVNDLGPTLEDEITPSKISILEFMIQSYIAFEDPNEAILYELMWS